MQAGGDEPADQRRPGEARPRIRSSRRSRWVSEGRGARADAQAAARDRREPARRTRSRTRSRSTPVDGENAKEIGRNLRAPTLPPGVEKINDGGAVSDRVVTVARVLSTAFLVATIVLLISSALLIANTIRLSIFSRRREIEVMKLVGATNWFVRGPFMLEGLICGVLGSVAAVLLLLIGKARRARADHRPVRRRCRRRGLVVHDHRPDRHPRRPHRRRGRLGITLRRFLQV